MYYVYILKRGKRENLYIGYTSNLRRRIEEHKRKLPCKIIYYESYLDEELARKREKG